MQLEGSCDGSRSLQVDFRSLTTNASSHCRGVDTSPLNKSLSNSLYYGCQAMRKVLTQCSHTVPKENEPGELSLKQVGKGGWWQLGVKLTLLTLMRKVVQ